MTPRGRCGRLRGGGSRGGSAASLGETKVVRHIETVDGHA
jgi:hypothetical protein